MVSKKSRINSTRVTELGFSNKSNLEWRENLMRRLASQTKGSRMTAIVIGVTTTTIIIQGARKEESIGKRDEGMINTEGTDIVRVVDEGTDIEGVDIGRKDVKGTDKEMMTVIAVEEGILVHLSRNLSPSSFH